MTVTTKIKLTTKAGEHLSAEQKAALQDLRDKAVREAGNACIDWCTDGEECHLCGYEGGEHDAECALAPYFEALSELTLSLGDLDGEVKAT